MAGAGATLVAHQLKRERNDKIVLDGISFTLAPGDRLGVVGPNGVGKTTLLRLLAGMDHPDSGRVQLAPPRAAVGYLAQDRERPPGETVDGYLRRMAGLVEAELALEKASDAFAAGDMSAAAQEAFDGALDRLSALAPDSFGERASRALADLGAAPGLLSAPVATLSGGELARAHLVAMILSRYDVYLLDEPTNDLDFTGLERLEQLVAGWSAPVMVVSHDRAFLSRTVTAVLEIDAHSK
ncbi:MAG TPA: ATP-binding cassette domain-containing protein, partial [Acidimicrobiales bacterium]|nr:ATP-binding cassette domain-containing protein [Acidimicrobiales bacterium]